MLPEEVNEVQKKVLVVDDDPDFLGMIRARLREAGYLVIITADSEEALRKVESEKPDVVLLDIQMPKVDGLKVLRNLRKIDKKLPAYMLTAFPNPERFQTAKKLGASGFIVKTSDLRKEVQNITASLRVAAKFRPPRIKP